MKRFLSLILAIILLMGCFAGCKKESVQAPDNPAPTDTVQAPTEPGQAPTEPTAPPATEPTLPSVPVDPRFESLAQEAVVKTALAFLNRGKYIQYDDTRFTTSVQIYRWEVGIKSPEDYNRQFTGYTNCAAFTYDVYKSALNYDIGAYTTANLTSKGSSMKKYSYIPTGKETADEMAAVEADFRANLKVGDIIVVRYNGDKEGNGHAMLYVGNEVLNNGHDIIHSTGSNYNYKDFTEKAESNGTVQTMSTSRLFSPSGSMYVFAKIKSLCLIRPLNVYKGNVPANTRYRILNMEGVVAEKLSSHTRSMTVNPGEEMTFQFAVSNKNSTPVTLEIRDVVPANTTYLSGAETVSGNQLSWTVTVPAKGNITVGYTVKVNSDAPYGETVYSEDGTVGGVSVKCPGVYIAKTLTAEQQAQILTAAKEISGKTGIELADAIYMQAIGKTTGLPGEFAALDDSIYNKVLDGHCRLKNEGGILDLIPAGMFGGRKISHRGLVADYLRLEYARTRLPQAEGLIIGDIIMAVGGPDLTETESLFLFLGDNKLLNLSTGKTQPAQALLNMLLGYDRFAVIRPSVGI